MRLRLALGAAAVLVAVVGGASQAAAAGSGVPVAPQPVAVQSVAPDRVVATFPYGSDAAQVVEVTWDPALPQGRAVVAFHGGSGYQGSTASIRRVAARLADEGFVVFNVEYRKNVASTDAGTVHWAEQHADALAALSWARGHAPFFGVDPRRIATYGFSWGGLLAADVALQPGSGVRAVASASGVLEPERVARLAARPGSRLDGDLSTTSVRYLYTAERWATQCGYAVGGSACAQRWAGLSPTTHLTPAAPPFLIFQGLRDDRVPVATARSFARSLARVGVVGTVVGCPTVAHSDTCAVDGGAHEQQLVDFLLAATT